MFALQAKVNGKTLYIRNAETAARTVLARNAQQWTERAAAEEAADFGWTVVPLFVCECCGQNAGDEYFSDDRVNATGHGQVLCQPCGTTVGGLNDAEFADYFGELQRESLVRAEKQRIAERLATYRGAEMLRTSFRG